MRAKQLSQETKKQLVQWVQSTLDEVALANAGGRIPLEKYLAALNKQRNAGLKEVETADGLSPKYLKMLWTMLHDSKPSLLLDSLRKKWREGILAAADIEPSMKSLWKYSSVGHIGKANGPKSWLEPTSPV